MPLTEVAIKNAKAGAKLLKLFDSGGLFLLVTSAGGKWWRSKCRFSGKEKLLNLGIYPDVPLSGRQDKKTGIWIDGARDKRDHAKQSGPWAKVTADAKLVRLEADLFPSIGTKPIRELSAATLLKILQTIEGRGANEIARRIRQMFG